MAPNSEPAINQSPLFGDVAVVGLSCRLAGGIENPEDFWQALLEKQVKSGPIPPMRWRHIVEEMLEIHSITKNGYFIEDIDHFDAAFFGISPKESPQIDPQQRLVLEAVWSALEDAGIPPQSLAGSNTAVYMGVNSDDYGKLLLEDLPGVEYLMGIGTAYCGVPNRVSYLLDLQGPSTAVDAACASSLVAIHHGRMSLLCHETDVAIVGGVNAICAPGLTKVLDEAGAISPEGTCCSFDESAKGYGRGEGAAVIILKRFEDAGRDNDNVLAVIKGSAVGQDGRTNGIMAPNEHAQEKVARLALGSIEPRSVQYIEAHATSTRLGDPVEVKAMSRVYGMDRGAQICYIGSVKPNVGHLEAGAGAVGFMKTVLSLQKGIIAPQANLQTLNTEIGWKTSGLTVPVAATPWPETITHTRRAAVCSYGYGGSVSHCVLESAPQNLNKVSESAKPDYSVILLSAPQEKRLIPDALALSQWMSGDGKLLSLSSIANTLANRRGHHDWRLGFIVSSHENVVESVQKYAVSMRGKVPKTSKNPEIILSRCLSKEHQKGAVWLFSGHGAQWSDMGKELLQKDPVFSAIIQELEPLVFEEMEFSIIEMLRDGLFPTTEKVAVLTFAMQMGMVASFESKGARPAAVMGHSIGEIAAAVVAGALTMREGILIACRRGRVFRKFKAMNTGTMAFVNGLSFVEMKKLLHGRKDIFAAIDSSPTSCVVSGKREAIAYYNKQWEKDNISVTKVESDIPFHSEMIGHLAVDLTELLLNDIKPKAPKIPLYSTTLQDHRQQRLRNVPYWVENMVHPVLLTGGVQALAEDGYRVFVEVSSHPIITHSVRETLDSMDIEDYTVIPTMVRNKSSQKSLLASLVAMWAVGIPVEWKSMFQSADWAKGVPKTKWNRLQYWKNVGHGPTDLLKMHDVHEHTLLGRRSVVAGKDITSFTTTLDSDSKPFPLSHPLHGTEIVPAAVLVNTLLKATGSHVLADMRLRVPVAVNAPRDIQVLVEKESVRLLSRLIQSGELEENKGESWLTHTTAMTKSSLLATPSSTAQSIDLPRIQKEIGSKLKDDFTKNYLASVGVEFMGFPWKVTHHFANKREMLTRVDVCPSLAEGKQFDWDPASWAPVLDSATSIASSLFYRNPVLRMPSHISRIAVNEGANPPKIAFIHVRDATVDDKNLAVDMSVTDENGKVLVEFTSMKFSQIDQKRDAKDLVYKLAWTPVHMSDRKLRVLKHKIIIGDETEYLTSTVMRHLAKRRVLTSRLDSFDQLSGHLEKSKLKEFAIFYIPGQVENYEDVPNFSRKFCQDLLNIVKYVLNENLPVKVFAITDDVLGAQNPTGIAHAPLLGLSRIIAAEHQDIWGALIDVDFECFPFQVVEHMNPTTAYDVVRIKDGVPRVARLQHFTKEDVGPASNIPKLHPHQRGTYLITSGLGALGLEVAAWMVENSARRIVLVSRHALPPRKEWSFQTGKMLDIIKKIKLLENHGVTIYSVAVDMSTPAAKAALSSELERLSLPPIRGVVHAAGITRDELVHQTTVNSFNAVLDPKITGAMVLHKMFPPSTLDFFVLFSSCGQLFGCPGQASYASGNAFLDSLATHRRGKGDNSIAFQWTAWKGLGLAAANEALEKIIEEELGMKGITSISRDEAFEAWNLASILDTDHAVVLHTLEVKAHQPLPSSILEDIVVRKPKHYAASVTSSDESDTEDQKEVVPSGTQARNKYFTDKITSCVATTLDMSVDEIDPKKTLLEMGMDSVSTLELRKNLNAALGVAVSPTLTWSCPTVSHLAKHFTSQNITSCPKVADVVV
ncbi:hypothetical protein EG329_002402 [Mollisiaceae sp. DMI_Dod_QoI]|nr:hypothetical protein EG329_002402 [Helotiales sp. DMI_Dod_QoI]